VKLPRLLLRTLLLAASLGIFAADTALASSPPPPTYPIAIGCTGLAGTWQRAYKVHLIYYYNGTSIYDHWASDGQGLFTTDTGKHWQKGGTLRLTAVMFYQSTGAQCGSYDKSFTFNGGGGAIQISDPNPAAGGAFAVNAPFTNMDWGSFMSVEFQ
jgi:hypothetical protein